MNALSRVIPGVRRALCRNPGADIARILQGMEGTHRIMTLPARVLWAQALFVIALSALAPWSRAGQICDLEIKTCARPSESRTVAVPTTAIWLLPRMPSCADTDRVATLGAAPWITLLIDNSSGVYTRTDPAGFRYAAATELIGRLSATIPDAQVALVVFSSTLSFDYRDNPYFKRALPGDSVRAYDSYVPFTKLSQAFKNGRRGADTLRSFLKYEPDSVKLVHETRRRPGYGTDLTLAFRAAKEAFVGAKAPKDMQYQILLTDGESSNFTLFGPEAEANMIKGKDLPTTFGLCFMEGGEYTVSNNFKTLIKKISQNGYSTSNPKGTAFSIVPTPGVGGPAPFDLSALLQSGVVAHMTTAVAAPKSATLGIKGFVLNSNGRDGESFLFPSNRIPLGRDTTSFSLGMGYAVEYMDSAGAKRSRDTSVSRDYLIVRTASVTEAPPGTALSCREQSDLAFYHQGSRLSIIRPAHTPLEARLTPLKGDSCAAPCRVGIQSLVGGDREERDLAKRSNFWRDELPQDSIAPVAKGDLRIQHARDEDSLILIYVNSENPLDSIRVSYAYVNRPRLLDMRRYGDLARGSGAAETGDGMQWILLGPPGLSPEPQGGSKCCRVLPGPLGPLDSAHYAGVTLSASRAFRFQAQIFSSLGEVVNTLSFWLSEAELRKLPPGQEPGTKTLTVLWDRKARDGRLAGTGAYVLKAKLTIIPDADERGLVSRILAGRIGVLR